MQMRFKRLAYTAKTPTRANEGDGGLDLYVSREEKVEESGKVTEFRAHSDIAVEIPRGYVGLLFPRSSISTRGVMMKNSVGVIDSGYRGEISARFMQTDLECRPYQRGERFGQLVIVPIELGELKEVADLSRSDRGSGGYGSSGE